MLPADRPDDTAVRADPAERWMARLARRRRRYPAPAARLRRLRVLALWLALPAYLAGIVLVPQSRRALLVAAGLLYLLWQLAVLARSRTIGWSSVARTLTCGALLAPGIGLIEIGVTRAAGWRPADPAAAVAVAGPVEEVLNSCRSPRWRCSPAIGPAASPRWTTCCSAPRPAPASSSAKTRSAGS